MRSHWLQTGRRVVGLFLVVGALPWTAEASCPSAYSSATCSAGTATEVCARIGNTWNCNLGAVGHSSAGTGYLIWDTTNTEYSAYGTAGNGSSFCCILASETGLTDAVLIGTTNGDTLSLYDSSSGYYAREHTSSLFRAKVYGNAGNDLITGSPQDNSNFAEFTYGEDGDDTISCLDGNDTAFGGPGNDSLDGDDGLDDLTGDAGDDIILGGADNDWITGGTGADTMNGEGGSDTLYGGGGNDTLCGGGYSGTADAFDGGDQNDLICGSDDGVETGTAGNGADVCYDSTTLVTSCTTTSDPSSCNSSCP